MKIKKWNGSAWVQEYPEVEVDSIVATGTPGSTTYLRGDGAWATIEAGGISKADLQNVYVYGKASGAITKGQAIQFAGAQGGHILIKTAVPSEINAEPTLMVGIAETDLAINEFGYVIVSGRLTLNTSAYNAGDLLYFASAGSTAGALTTTEPTDPNASIQMAVVSIDGIGNGEFLVRKTILSRHINEVIGLQGALDGKAATSHTHAISAITNLQTSLDAKQDDLGSGTTGQFLRWGALGDPYWDTVTASEVGAYASNNPSGFQTSAQVATAISNLVDSSPAALDTLNELAAALGDDPNFATTVSNSIGTKLSLTGGTMTGVITTPNGTHGIIIGDDSRLADRNVGNTLFLEGVQNTDRGYINFSQTTGNQLGAINGGALTWRGANLSTESYVTTRGYITSSGSISGNAATATKLATARNIALTGAVTGNANFDGSGNISIATTATADPTLTLSGDASGSATFTNLGNATLSVTVNDDSHEHTRLSERASITYGASYLQWTDTSGVGGSGTNGAAPSNPTNEWWHHLIMNHANGAGYYFDIAAAFHTDSMYFRRNTAGTLSGWREIIHSGNIGSQSVSNANTVDGYHIVVGSTGSDASTLYFVT
jgi:hypothetical protein